VVRKVTSYSRGIHGRDEIESDVTTACGLESDERLNVFQEIDLVLETFACVGVDSQVERLVRRELATTTTNAHRPR